MSNFFSVIFLIFISFFPVLLIALYIYKKDRNKEPKSLLFKLFRHGIMSAILTIVISIPLEFLLLYFGIDSENLTNIEAFFYYFVIVALVEEFCKWLMVYLVSYRSIYFDEIYDMIVYSVFVALGFALFENLLYVFQGGLMVACIRAITAIPAHACCGVIMGYFLSYSKIKLLNNDSSMYNKYLGYSLIIPILVHGLYDFSLSIEFDYSFILFIVILILMYIYSIKMIKKISNLSNFKNNNYCGNCGVLLLKDSLYCNSCGVRINRQ